MLRRRSLLALACAAALGGCATANKPIFISPTFDKPMKVAVLPFENMSTDLAAGELARLLFAEGIGQKGYTVIPIEKVDEVLRKMGVTQGGQLRSLKREDMMKKLGAEGLIYGNLKAAAYVTVGIKKSKKATLAAALYRGEERLWEDEKTFEQSEYSINPASAIQKQLAGKALEKALAKYSGHPLYLQIEQCVYKTQDTMPGKRVEESGW